MDDLFSDGQLKQFRTVIREEVRDELQAQIQGPEIKQVLSEQISTQLQGPTFRQVLRDEVRSEVTTQLQPVHTKLDAIVENTTEDIDVLASDVMKQGRQIAAVKKQVAPLVKSR